jgi:hypothetical protein
MVKRNEQASRCGFVLGCLFNRSPEKFVICERSAGISFWKNILPIFLLAVLDGSSEWLLCALL